MNSKDLSKIKNKLKNLIKQKEILDIIIFGSAIKGKINPNDIDITIISNKKDINIKLDKYFHVSIISIEDFFIKPISLINTLLREGFSIRHNKSFSEVFNFYNKTLFVYNLKKISNTNKVKLVNILHGRKDKGLVETYKGEWLANQVFLVPIENEKIFEELFLKFNIPFKRSYILIH